MQEIKELNKLLSKYVDDGFFPGIQWQINIDNDQPCKALQLGHQYMWPAHMLAL